MSDEEQPNELITKESVQGLHNGSFKRLIREQYDCHITEHIERFFRDGKWWDRWYVPLKLEEIIPRDRNKVEEEIIISGKPCGLHMVVRNYHYRPVIKTKQQQLSAEDKKIKAALRYEEHKEEARAYARKRYEQLKQDPEWMLHHRNHMRDHYREKNYVRAGSEETVRRHDVKRMYDEAVRLEVEGNETRIAELMTKDDQGLLTQIEMIELEDLLNGTSNREEGHSSDTNIMP